ncbi:phage major capsid protein [Fructobacillus sp. CRL 2054]|uniref:phage major capsid protein n=1 Tax=Fructobacillus sp. CRL 2054 TaxID=2763007 RepID=UPI002379A96B|nr:phage major capsid protein [Fructobacillus sp. CRL 2054]MDD9138317.1 phage major capsid protein [Fructobacillus sp. CRL 2054]
MDINALQKTFTDAGQKVSDLRAEAQAMAINDAVTAEEITAKQAEIKNAVAKRDLAKENLESAQADIKAAEVMNAEKKPLTAKEEAKKNTFIQDFKNMVAGKPFKNELNSSTDENGNAIGLVIPVDAQTAIRSLVREFDSLQEYVNVEKVSTLSGSRVIEKSADMTPLTVLDAEDGVIPANDDPKLSLIKYLIKRYAGMTTITNSLLSDSAENILAWLTGWISKKVVVTRNAAILAELPALPKKATIASYDDVKDMAITALDPAIAQTSMFFTNQSGFAELAKMKDGNGQYLITQDPQQADAHVMEGKQVKVLADRFFPAVAGANPLVFGDLSQAITLFDRDQMSIATTNVGADAFTTDTTKLRVIDRFDVELVDQAAVVVGSFKSVAASTPKTSN